MWDGLTEFGSSSGETCLGLVVLSGLLSTAATRLATDIPVGTLRVVLGSQTSGSFNMRLNSKDPLLLLCKGSVVMQVNPEQNC